MKKPNKQRTLAANELATYINKVIPLINKRLTKGYKLKKDGSLFKKDYNDINDILNKNKTGLKTGGYLSNFVSSTFLRMHTNYKPNPAGDAFHVEYIVESIYLFSIGTPFRPIIYKAKIHKNKNILKTWKIVQKIEKSIRALQDEISDIETNYSLVNQ
jgi:hypothetical protein